MSKSYLPYWNKLPGLWIELVTVDPEHKRNYKGGEETM